MLMSRPGVARIVRALDLIDGDVIYLAANGGWTRRLAEAAVARTEREATALLAAARMQPDEAEEPVLAEVVVDRGRPRELPTAAPGQQPAMTERARA